MRRRARRSAPRFLRGSFGRGVDDVGVGASGQDLDDRVDGHLAHRGARLSGGAADVRREDGVRCAQQPAAHVGLVVEHVDPRPAEPARGERLDEGGLVEDGSACRVDHDRPGWQQRDATSVDQVLGLVGEWDMEADRVRVAHEVVEVRDVPRRTGVPAGVVAHDHLEGPCAVSDLAADAPVADEPEAHPGEVATERRGEPEAAPLAPAERRAVREQASADRQQEDHREVGRRGVEHTRGVAHRDPVPSRGIEVDVVVADGDVRDDAQRGGTRGDDLLVDPIAQQRDDAHRAPSALAERVVVRRPVTGKPFDLVAGVVEPSLHVAKEWLGDHDALRHAATVRAGCG